MQEARLHNAGDGRARRLRSRRAMNIEEGRRTMAHRHHGIVKSILSGKGYGFIRSAIDGVDVFFHHSGVAPSVKFDELQPGTRVSFIERPSPKGPRAEQIERA